MYAWSKGKSWIERKNWWIDGFAREDLVTVNTFKLGKIGGGDRIVAVSISEIAAKMDVFSRREASSELADWWICHGKYF